MKIVIAPDSFKGSLGAADVCRAIASGLRRVVADAEIINLPMADGGEGTVDALTMSTGGQLRRVEVCGPLGKTVEAVYGILGPQPDQGVSNGIASTAVIEISAAAGLTLVPVKKRNPLYTTTFGVGQIILNALDQNCRNFIIGIGGSATTDCGTGMAQALGVKFLDKAGREITEPMTGERMGHVFALDNSRLDPRLPECHFAVACDVENPLLGPNGASYVYASQKGAGEMDIEVLEANMAYIIGFIEKMASKVVRDMPGAGAAGGLGAGLSAFLDARLERGIEIVMRYCRFDQQIRGADLIITGEGRIDGQTVYGKTIAGIAAAARAQDIPIIALAGSLGADARKVLDIGVTALFSICPGPISLVQAMQQTPELLADTVEQTMRLMLIKN